MSGFSRLRLFSRRGAGRGASPRLLSIAHFAGSDGGSRPFSRPFFSTFFLGATLVAVASPEVPVPAVLPDRRLGWAFFSAREKGRRKRPKRPTQAPCLSCGSVACPGGPARASIARSLSVQTPRFLTAPGPLRNRARPSLRPLSHALRAPGGRRSRQGWAYCPEQ